MSAAERLGAARARPTDQPQTLPLPLPPLSSSSPPGDLAAGSPSPPSTLPDSPQLRGAGPAAAESRGQTDSSTESAATATGTETVTVSTTELAVTTPGVGTQAVSSTESAPTTTGAGSGPCQAAPPCPAAGRGKDLCCEDAQLLTAHEGVIQAREATGCKAWRICLEPGYSVDLTLHGVDLDPLSQYLLVAPDENSLLLHSNPVFTGKLSTEYKFRLPHKGSAYILFRATVINAKLGSFNFSYSKHGELTTPQPSTTPDPVQRPPKDGSASITVFVAGVAPKEFNAVGQDFQKAVAKRATSYCMENKIPIGEGSVRWKDVLATNGSRCPSTWPGTETCVQLALEVAVAGAGATEYELSRKHLQDLWDRWGAGARITDRLTIYKRTDFTHEVIIWAITCAVIIVLFCIFLTFFWRWLLRREIKEKAKISCSAPQEVEWPPMFEYMDQKYDDPEYMPSYDIVYMGTESSTDDPAYGSLPSYEQVPGGGGGSTFLFSSSKQGVDNDAFLEDDEEEYDILNRSKLASAKNASSTYESTVHKTQGDKPSRNNEDHVHDAPEKNIEARL